MNKLINLAEQLGESLEQKKQYLATAESCTGGQIAETITAIPGSSNYFDRGFVTYSNEAKQEMLGVSATVIKQHGAVSEEVARAMAEGAIQHSCAQVSIAVTGIAGPGGGSREKHVGTVWLAWSMINPQQRGIIKTYANCYNFSGNRIQIRTQAVEMALQELLKVLSSAS